MITAMTIPFMWLIPSFSALEYALNPSSDILFLSFWSSHYLGAKHTHRLWKRHKGGKHGDNFDKFTLCHKGGRWFDWLTIHHHGSLVWCNGNRRNFIIFYMLRHEGLVTTSWIRIRPSRKNSTLSREGWCNDAHSILRYIRSFRFALNHVDVDWISLAGFKS